MTKDKNTKDIEFLANKIAALETTLDEHCSYLHHIHDSFEIQSKMNDDLHERIKISLKKVQDLQKLEEYTDSKVSGILVKVMRQVGTVQQDLILAIEQAEMNDERITRALELCNDLAMESHMRERAGESAHAFPNIKFKKEDSS